jgi:uncharacterized protein YoxC
MSLHDLFFGFDQSEIIELQGKVAELEKLFENFKGLPGQMTELSDKFGNLSAKFTELSGKFNDLSGNFTGLSDKFNGLQEKFTGLQEQVGTLKETVADQEKIMLTCCIVASVVTIAAISFIGFCIYQGMKREREKQKGLSQNVPTGELSDLLEPETKLGANDNQNGLQVDGQDNVLQTADL